MRPIKFRAWHKKLKIMLYPPHETDSMTSCRPHTVIEIEGERFPLTAHMTWDGRWYVKGRYQDVVWMQFTGLPDKNGKELWEGDVVKFDGHTYEDKFIAIIVFSNGMFRPEQWMEPLGNYKYMEILGNIYENPELIK